jgi:hypothetical protein
MEPRPPTPIKYCFCARKSTEEEDKQVLLILFCSLTLLEYRSTKVSQWVSLRLMGYRSVVRLFDQIRTYFERN